MAKAPNKLIRFIVYPLIALFFIVLCYFVALSALGYNLEIRDGKFVKTPTGMMVIATKPGDAFVYLDGKIQKRKSPVFSFLSLTIKKVSVGTHNLRIEKSGYETWEGNIAVEPELVTWGNYIILVPLKREAQKFELSGDLVGTVLTEDKSRMIAQAENLENGYRTFWDINLQTKENKRVRQEKMIAGETVSLLAFNNDATRVLAKTVKGEKTEYFVFEAKDAGLTWNITQLFKMDFDRLGFSTLNRGELYVSKAGDIYSLDYESKKLSSVIASSVIDYYTNNNNVYVIKKTEGNVGLWRITGNSALENIVKALPFSDSYQFRHIKSPDSYLILSRKDKELTYYKKDSSGKPVTELLGTGVNSFAVSPKEENVALMLDKEVKIFDLEKEKYYSTLPDKVVSSLSWMNDAENIVYSAAGKVGLVNFNGIYDKTLFDNTEGTPVYSVPGSANFYFTQGVVGKRSLNVFSFNF